MKVFKDKDYVDASTRILRIKPEGWIDELVFRTHEKGFSQCGQTEAGIHVRINDQAGGVMTLDDLLSLHNMIVKHFNQLSAQMSGQEE